MFIETWYCPKCDRPTNNYRTCGACGTEAVYQRFACWPVPHEAPLPECYLSISEKKKARQARWEAANGVRSKAQAKAKTNDGLRPNQ